MNVQIIEADYHNPKHQKDIPFLLNLYATDLMGGGKPLSDFVKHNLVTSLAGVPHAFSVLAYVGGEPAGLVNCFQAFSTFACKPLVNIHDVVVHSNFRGQGVAKLMLEEVERIARGRGCCKLTLEVLAHNQRAQFVYATFGFAGYELDPKAGAALFWQKTL